jgi:hypothetical protein
VAGEIVTALIAAGAAVSGGLVTGWFTVLAARRQAGAALEAATRQAEAAWAAGQRQADAAWEAGQRQAEAQLDVARRTLGEQALAAQRAVRRTAYVTFLSRTDAARQTHESWQRALGTPEASVHREAYAAAMAAVQEAFNIVRLEGPARVTAAADIVRRTLPPSATAGDHAAAQDTFLVEARAALAPPS